MTDPTTFADFVRRVRAGDGEAAAELVRAYEPLIRREVRLHLEDPRLGRLFDSMDVCQSVLGSFFLRVAAGQYDLERPENLARLLVTMARHKLASAARGQRRQRRDQRRVAADGNERLAGVADPRQGPGSAVAGAELLRRFREGLSEEEARLVDHAGRGAGVGRRRGPHGRHAPGPPHAAGPGRRAGRPRAGAGTLSSCPPGGKKFLPGVRFRRRRRCGGGGLS
jgi:RNA polymerase sigma-70 factor (ECF subfamily)